MGINGRREYLAAILKRYQQATKKQKKKILDDVLPPKKQHWLATALPQAEKKFREQRKHSFYCDWQDGSLFVFPFLFSKYFLNTLQKIL